MVDTSHCTQSDHKFLPSTAATTMQRIAVSVLAAACLLAAASPAAAFGLGSWVTARATYVRPSHLDRRLILNVSLFAAPLGLTCWHYLHVPAIRCYALCVRHSAD